MLAQLVLFVSVFAFGLASPSAAKYPAGLNPNLCPNYPHCDNALLAAHSQQNGVAGAFHQAPTSAFGPSSGLHLGYTGHFPGAYGHSAPAYAAPGYPAGVNPAACPNYPYCTNYAPTPYHAAPLPGFAHRQYPDGVNPSTCPNYPFCH